MWKRVFSQGWEIPDLLIKDIFRSKDHAIAGLRQREEWRQSVAELLVVLDPIEIMCRAGSEGGRRERLENVDLILSEKITGLEFGTWV